jgi:hypothetical protein
MRGSMRLWIALYCTSAGWAASLAYAHHSFAMFDMSKNVTLVGTVKDFQWTNPHVWIDLLVDDPAGGQAALWEIEGGSTAVLARGGWKRDSMKAGDKVSLVMHPLKQGNNGGTLVSASVNGEEIGGGQFVRP